MWPVLILWNRRENLLDRFGLTKHLTKTMITPILTQNWYGTKAEISKLNVVTNSLAESIFMAYPQRRT